MMSEERVVEELENLYAMLPSIECKGLCWNSCGPIDMSDTERERIREQGVEIQPFTPERVERWNHDEPLHCSALTEDKRCSVYEVRPMVCRLWGVAESMPCPHGCKPTPGYLLDENAMTLLAHSMEVGGGTIATADELTRMMADPEIGPLVKRFIRGDKSAERELIELFQARNKGEA